MANQQMPMQSQLQGQGQPMPIANNQPMQNHMQMQGQPGGVIMYNNNTSNHLSNAMMVPNQPMIMPNGMLMMPVDPNFFGGMRCFYVSDPFTELANAKKASIKQRFEPWEALSGCETANQYYVFIKDKEGNEKYLFKAKEESTWCCRNCIDGRSREFTLHLRTIQHLNGKEKKEDFADFHRPFKCTCCCLSRPELKGSLKKDLTSGTSTGTSGAGSVGRIVQPCTVCDPKITVFNRDGIGAWTITCNCCQCGYMCANTMWGKCSEVDFEVYQGMNVVKGNAQGAIKKKFKGLKSILGDADFFDLTFPEKATPEERLLLITAVIMLDYLYFEDKDNHSSPLGMLNYI